MSEELQASRQEEAYSYTPAGDGNPQYLQEHPNAETDPSRAHDMAIAGDSARSSAVEDRQRAEEAAKEEQEAQGRLEEFQGRAPRFIESELSEARRKKEWALRDAREWDLAAHSREEWAGILHDHPVNDAYKQAHPEASFTPEGLDLLEDHIASLRRQNEDLPSEEEVMKRFEDPVWGSHHLQVELGYQTTIDPEDYSEDEEEGPVDIAEYDPELAALLNNGDTTINDLKDYYKIKERRYYEEKRQKLERLEKILEDVKSGKAAEYTGEEVASEENQPTEVES